ncbi:MAG: PolC-type DNA polymerase III [Ruminococcaceae bacterium]|nr:PolC-type DNA polymerase III [Oscillospiraceae bacterium]
MRDKGVAFLEIFPFLESLNGFCSGLETAVVTSATIVEADNTMRINAFFEDMISPSETSVIESAIKDIYDLSEVILIADFKMPKSENRNEEKTKGKQLFGKKSNSVPVPISEIDFNSGTVTVSGEVFAVESRDMGKNWGRILSFFMTDNTESIKVSRSFYKKDKEDASIIDKIKVGQYLTVRGKTTINKYEEEMIIEPTSIRLEEKEIRQDLSDKKRVELHLHTRYSALDAICDPKKLIDRLALWGHSAVAVTDHGSVQSFPEFNSYAKKKGIKVIYGVEGYYVNDDDEQISVKGNSENDIDSEVVVFDLETTGLFALNDRIIEIGAVVLKNGEVSETFQTYVNPEMPISDKITELTGISDRDVKDAAKERDAIESFLEFVNGRPLAAHNADFDISFIEDACSRHEIDFEFTSIDTLALAQRLLPELRRHRLDIVAKHLEIPDFTHHRASDDAGATALVLAKFFNMLKERGVNKISEIDDEMRRLSGDEHRRVRHITLLARNKTGLKNLYKLISASYTKHYRRFPIIPKSLLMKHRDGLLVGSACVDGEVFAAVLRGAPGAELRRIASFYDYLEIMPVSNNSFLLRDEKLKDEDALRDINRRIARLAAEAERPCVATGDVHFIDPEDEVYRRILLASKKFKDADEPMPLYLKTTDEMLDEFSYLDNKTCYDVVIGNPNKIAEMCEEISLFPKGLFPPKIENSAQELTGLVKDKMHSLYGENPPDEVKIRVETELSDILSRNYDVIYMSAQKLVSESNKNGYIVGSRGSVGSSIVAYLSGITEVNSLPAHYLCPACKFADFISGKGYGCGADMPDKTCPSCGTKMGKEGFDIPFETFLGFGGDKVPDIDLNFSGEYQARAHKHTEELFGAECVFRAGTIGTIAQKTAYGFIKKYHEERGIKTSNAEEERLTCGLVGVKRTTGQHPGGLVIIPRDMEIEDFCPVQHPADDISSGIITTHFDYHCMEDNLLKLDELGHDDPTMLKMLEDMTGVDVRSIPLDDPDTMRIFRSSDFILDGKTDKIIGNTGTIGIPEFGTGFTRQMLEDIVPQDFETLVRISGFSHGEDVWVGNAKDLVKEGNIDVKATIGCRDDIMLYLITKGIPEKRAFAIMEAVRKGKGLPKGAEAEMKEAHVPAWYIESCNKIKYLFPKAHAVAYVTMAFRIAWFKVHYPLEFYSAYFYRRSQKDAFNAGMMLKGKAFIKKKIAELAGQKKLTQKEDELLTSLEAAYEFNLRGYEFAPVDLYKSDQAKFKIEGENMLRPPFISVSGLGAAAAADLAACRDSGREFVSVEDMLSFCTKVSSANIEQLMELGALGDMPEKNQISLF